MQKKRILANVKVMSKKGFTLIELLITITIIVILAAIGIITYQSVLKSGRDSKRQSDLRSIQSALEQYRSDQGSYSATISFSAGQNISSGTRIYLNEVPLDPTGSPQYCYHASPDTCTSACTSYELYAKLENPPAGAGTYTCNATTYNFRVTPP